MALDGEELEARFALVYPAFQALRTKVQTRYGYILDADAESAGLDAALLEALVDAGLIVRAAPGLLNLNNQRANASLEDHAIRAWIMTGQRAVVSHESALALLGIGEPPKALHLTFPLNTAGSVGEMEGVELHFADVAEPERSWYARAPVPVTEAHRTLRDCAAAGVDEAVLAYARAEAQRCRLIATPGEPVRPPVADAALRLALFSELVPLREISERLERLSGEELAAWARASPLHEETLPTSQLKWSETDLLWPAVNAGDDGVVRELSGIEGYPALTTVDLRRSRVGSLEPLVALGALCALHVGVEPDTSLEPLLRCPSLRRVRLDGYVAAVHLRVRDALEARGVIFDLLAGDERPIPTPFADPMLKLAVIEALSRQGAIELPALVPIDDDELDPELLNRLLAIPLSHKQLATITELEWSGGGETTQHVVWPQYDGESDEFHVRSLGGIEHLPNLRRLTLQWCWAGDDHELDELRARGIDAVIE